MPKLSLRGVEHHYQRLGHAAGTPAVFVHGLVMDNLSSWYLTVASAVARERDVLLYDLRGHGLSERPATGYHMHDFVQDLGALLDATLGPTPVCLVGNSFGGAIALEFTRLYPARVASMLLVDGHLGADDFQDTMIATLSLRGAEAERVAAELLRNWHARGSPRKRESLARNARALLEGTSLVADLREKPPLKAADFAAIETRTLALYGEHSDALAASRPSLARMPHCRLELLAGCSHLLLSEAPDIVRARVVEFCRGQTHAPLVQQ